MPYLFNYRCGIRIGFNVSDMRYEKIIFCDVVGTLHTNFEFSINAQCMKNLKRIVDATDATVVISSDIRKCTPELNELRRRMFFDHGVKFRRSTPVMDNLCRADEIHAFIMEMRDMKGYVALDDSYIFRYDKKKTNLTYDQERDMADHYVQVMPHLGLTEADADKAIKILNEGM